MFVGVGGGGEEEEEGGRLSPSNRRERKGPWLPL